MNDDAHHENVGDMIDACRIMSVPFSQVSTVICTEWMQDAAQRIVLRDGKRETADVVADLNFAAGYLQATSNLTGKSWADQLADAAALEDGPAMSPDHLATDVGAHLADTDKIVARINKELEAYRMSQIDDAICFAKGRELQCIQQGALFEAYIYSRARFHLETNKEEA